jgi:hypothetical protein
LASPRARRFTDEAILDLLLLDEKDEEERPAIMGSRSPGWNSINPHCAARLAWIQREGFASKFLSVQHLHVVKGAVSEE